MKPDPMTMMREHVQGLLTHLPAAATRGDTAGCNLPLVVRFAAGDDVSTDDLHRALCAIEHAVLLLGDRALCMKAAWASNYALMHCSAEHTEIVRKAFTSAMERLGAGIKFAK